MARLLTFLASLLLQTQFVESVSGNCAKNVLWDTEISEHFNQDTQKYVKETKISFSIGLQETVCFDIEGKNGMTEDATVDGRQYYFSFEDVQTIFNYKNAYQFGLGEPNVKCLCDCPGVENHCSPSRENCKEDKNSDSNCFNYYSDDQSTTGCGITSFLGTGEVCCSISVNPATQTKYTAFEIANPVTRSLFRIEKDSPFESRFFASDLASGSPHFDGKLQITFLNPGNINPLPNGWYFGDVNNKEAYTNVEVNGLIDWDINKLGWYKFQNGRFALSQTAVKNAFNSHVLNCDDSAMNVSFYSEVNMTYAKKLEEFYASTISKAERNDDERTLSLQYFDFSKINVMITVSGEKRVVLRYNMPSFLDFNADAMFDKHSNRFLNVTIISGKGTLYGAMRVGTEVANFDFIIPSEGGRVTNYTNYVQITQWCNDTMQADLCFHAGDNQEKCKVIECSEEALMDFVLPETAIDYEIIAKPNFFGMETWSRYMNPLEWFNGIDNWQEGVIMLISILMYLIIISILVKLFTCFKCGAELCGKVAGCCCICCRRKKKDTSNKDRRKARKEHHYEDIEMDGRSSKSARRKGSKLPTSPTGSVRSNISQRHRKVTRNRGFGNSGYVGSSFKSAQSSLRSARSSFRRASQRSRRLMEQNISYSDSELLRETEIAEGREELLNSFLSEFGRRKYELFRAMWDEYGMPPQDVCPDQDGTKRPPYGSRDDVCLDIDSDEGLDRRNMFNDPHKQKRQQNSQQSRRKNKDRTPAPPERALSPRSQRGDSPASRSERAFSPKGRNNRQYSSMPHRHRQHKHNRDGERGRTPRGSEDQGDLTIGKRKGKRMKKTLDHTTNERAEKRRRDYEERKRDVEDSYDTTEDSSSVTTSSIKESSSKKVLESETASVKDCIKTSPHVDDKSPASNIYTCVEPPSEIDNREIVS